MHVNQSVKDAGWLPVAGEPVALIVWRASDDGLLVMPATWLAIIGSRPPELRMGGGAVLAAAARSLEDADFTVNIPGERGCDDLRRLMGGAGSVCLPVPADDLKLVPSRLVRAPLLADCALQLECGRGRFLPGSFEPELAGDLLLLHRGGFFVDPAGLADFCALAPLRVVVPS